MRNIEGKVVLLTGAASGIGKALALRLAQEGARLCLLDVDEVRLNQVVAQVKGLGAQVRGDLCDVAQPKQVDRSVDRMLRHWGEIDILVNNAGITYYGRTDKMSLDHWQQLLAVNLHGPVHLTHRLLPSLLTRPESHILNVASICGLVGLGRVAAYSTSKFALVGFSESLRAEYGRRGLGVTALCPGFVDTRLFESAPLGGDRQQSKHPPGYLLVTPEKVAHRAVRAIYRNQAMVVMQPYARLLYATKRFGPWILDGINQFSRQRFMKSKIPGGSKGSQELPRSAA